jgi:hypothetical protein
MKKSFYNTDKRKYNYIYRHWKKDDLMSLLEDYLLICGVDEDCMIFLEMEENLKTKKAILNKYLNLVWDIVMEENDNID